jgi:hypothetical protein
MRCPKIKLFFSFLFGVFLSGVFLFGAGFAGAPSAQAAANLNGRILLQVQDLGQAWYVNPLNGLRYYLGRPDDAFAIMRSLGLGVSNNDTNNFLAAGAPSRLAGRILLQVQDKGQAYYVDPLDLRLYYLGRPTDAFNLMRSKGLGITNVDLAKIAIYQEIPGGDISAKFVFKYQNNSYELIQNLSSAWYDAYRNSTKIYSYNSASPPANIREAFYGLFLTVKSGDTSLDELTAKIKAIAALNSWTNDQIAEFALAFIQYIPYDQAKLAESDNRNTNPYYPYETLYLNRGVCSDKTFLAVALLRKLGYGAAILDFPDSNHSAVGIACPVADSLNNSGYCYGETTNFFPLGVVPRNIAAGQAQSAENSFTDLFNIASLGSLEIYQKSAGRLYGGLPALRAKVAALAADSDALVVRQGEIEVLKTDLQEREDRLNVLKIQMDDYYNNGQISQYNSLVSEYNVLVSEYNVVLNTYRAQVDTYNILVAEFNAASREFYQK